MKSKYTKIVAVAVILFLMVACGGDSSKEVEKVVAIPTAAILVSPLKDEPCNQGSVLSELLSTITFSWEASKNTDQYIVVIESLEDNSVKQIVSSSTTASVNLSRGVSFKWHVVSKSDTTSKTSESEIWTFYNAAEGTESHVPYPATLVAPSMGIVTATKTITLSWSSNDLDNDIVSYEVYLDTDSNPSTLHTILDKSILENVSLSPNTTYYWKVHSKDNTGNVSISSVFKFTTGI
ncbi:hypothetical protein Q4595_02740 [Wenyingzhuangia sp. 1_MG-2023]|nr:hypothetical protein [Wenyingzhuangia sp. 1_MG-2023]